jgi:hypothetical protein
MEREGLTRYDWAISWTSRVYMGIGSPATEFAGCVSMLHRGQVLYILRTRNNDELEFI